MFDESTSLGNELTEWTELTWLTKNARVNDDYHVRVAQGTRLLPATLVTSALIICLMVESTCVHHTGQKVVRKRTLLLHGGNMAFSHSEDF